jgi:hypothetical protein
MADLTCMVDFVTHHWATIIKKRKKEKARSGRGWAAVELLKTLFQNKGQKQSSF